MILEDSIFKILFTDRDKIAACADGSNEIFRVLSDCSDRCFLVPPFGLVLRFPHDNQLLAKGIAIARPFYAYTWHTMEFWCCHNLLRDQIEMVGTPIYYRLGFNAKRAI